MSLFEYCVLAQRLGSSRQLALRVYRAQGNTVDTDVFRRAWFAGRASSRLAGLYPGLAR